MLCVFLTPDPSVLEQIKPYKEKIQKYQQEIVGSTDVILEANRKKETNLGNLVTDSMVHWVLNVSILRFIHKFYKKSHY